MKNFVKLSKQNKFKRIYLQKNQAVKVLILKMSKQDSIIKNYIPKMMLMKEKTKTY